MTNVFWRTAFSVLLGLTLLAFATGCDDDDNLVGDDDDDDGGTEATASLRVVHAAPQADTVDVFIEGEEAVADFVYSAPTASVSDFIEVGAGEEDDLDIEVRPDGSDEAVIDAALDLDADSTYTLLAAGTAPDIEGVLLSEDLSAPEAGNAKVRLVHAASTVGPVDIYVTAPDDELPEVPTFEAVAFTASTGYTALAAGDYRVRITAAEADDDGEVTDEEVVIDTQALLGGSLFLGEGGIFTAIAVDPAEDGGAPSAILITEED